MVAVLRFFMIWPLIGVAIFGVISGCASPAPSPELPLRESTSSQLLEKLQQKESSILSLKALFRANVQGDGVPVSYRIDGVFLYKRPSVIRLKGFTRFGGIAFDFLVDGEHYQLKRSGEGPFSSGKLTELKGTRELGIPLQLSLRAVKTLLGKIEKKPGEHMVFVKEGTQYRFDIFQMGVEGESVLNKVSRRVWVDRRRFQVSRLEYLSFDGVPYLTVQAQDFRRVRDASAVEQATIVLPFTIEAEDRIENGSITLDFQEMVANAPLGPKDFQFVRF